jgi:ubiquinol-cytochrome c reductase cytochrome c subunit
LAALTAAAVLLMVGLGPSAHAQGPSPATTAVTDNQVADGRLLYLQNCASCHGTGAQGSGIAPPLTNVGAAAFDFYLRTGRMPLAQLGTPPWQQSHRMSDDQIAALVSYGATLGQGPAIPSVVAGAGDLQRGWDLYTNNCSACHGPGGAGGELAAGVAAPPLDRADELAIAEAMLIGPGQMPSFADLPQQDVNSITRYVLYLRQRSNPGGVPPSDTGPVAEGFIALLLGLGAMLLATRWVTQLRR